jgi:hypothetical protein
MAINLANIATNPKTGLAVSALQGAFDVMQNGLHPFHKDQTADKSGYPLELFRTIATLQRGYNWTVELPNFSSFQIPTAKASNPNSGGLFNPIIKNPTSIQISAFGGSLQNLLSPNQTADTLPSSVNVNQSVSMHCQSVTFGNYSIDKNEMRDADKLLKFAGLTKIEDCTMNFLEDDTGIVYKYFSDWRSSVIGPDGSYGLKNDYSFTVKVYFWTTRKTDNSPKTPATHVIGFYSELKGCFPLTMPQVKVDYKTDSILSYDINFSVDSVNFVPNLSSF